MTSFRGREKLIDVREERRGAERLEFRKDGETGQYILEGYAATHDPYDVQGGPTAGGWVEQLSQRAFDKTLAADADVQLLINHEGTPLARTKSGTLKLSHDSHGLRVLAFLDPTDPDVQRLAPKMLRGDMDEMSFAFRVKDQQWDNTYSHRTINELSLQKGDVSVVNYGMNPGTRAILSAEAVGTLAQLGQSDLAELRKLDASTLVKAQKAIEAAVVRKAGDSEPYGDVKYADPGYKKDGRKRYPIDTEEHAKAAWSYINMPKNHKGYTADQVQQIKNRVRSALDKFGVQTEKKSVDISHIDSRTNSDGETVLVAVMTDGSRVPLPTQREAAPPTHEAGEHGNFAPQQPGWNPSATNLDPHNDDYSKGVMGPVGTGQTPSNIVGGSMHYLIDMGFDPTVTPSDPHDIPFDVSGDLPRFTPDIPPHWNATDSPGDPHDQKFLIGAKGSPDTGPVAPNIVAGGRVGSMGEGGYGWNPDDHPGDPHNDDYDEVIGRAYNDEREDEGYVTHQSSFAHYDPPGINLADPHGDPHDCDVQFGDGLGGGMAGGPMAENIDTTGRIGALTDSGYGWNPGDTPTGDPHDCPVEPNVTGSFTPYQPGWNPGDPHDDPHNASFSMGDGLGGGMATGPTPPNIVGGGKVGSLTDGGYGWNPSDPHGDPHDEGYDEYVGRGMDPHDTPYDMGPQVGPNDHNRPNFEPYLTQPVHAPNIVAPGFSPSASNFMTGDKVRPAYGPGYGQVPANPVVGMPGSGLNRPVAGSNPAYSNRGVQVFSGSPVHPTGTVHGHQVASHGAPDTGWQPSNIMTDAGPHNTQTGQGYAPMQGSDTEWEENPPTGAIDLNIAQALDRTIVHAYKLAKGNTELRKYLALMHYQACSMQRRRAQQPQQQRGQVSALLSQLQGSRGMPDTGSVSAGLAFLEQEGSNPIGYRGLLRHQDDDERRRKEHRARMLADAKQLEARALARNAERARVEATRIARDAEIDDAVARLNRARAIAKRI